MVAASAERPEVQGAFSLDEYRQEVEAAIKVLSLGGDRPAIISQLLDQLMELARSKEASSGPHGEHLALDIILQRYEAKMNELVEALHLPSPEAVNYVLGSVNKAVPTLKAYVYANPLTEKQIEDIKSVHMPAAPITQLRREGD